MVQAVMSNLSIGSMLEYITDWTPIVVSVIAVCASLWINYDSKRPDVIVYFKFDIDKQCMYLVIQNFGKGIAYNIRFYNNDDNVFMDNYRDKVKDFLSAGIQMLPPGGKRVTVVASGNVYKMKDGNGKLITSELSITYEERSFLYYLCRRMKKNKNNFVLDYESFDGIYAKSELRLIRSELNQICEEIKKLSNSS